MKRYSPEWYERDEERADEPHTWAESWFFIAPLFVIAVLVYVWQSGCLS